MSHPPAPPATGPMRRIARVFTMLFCWQTLLSAAPAYAQLSAAPGAPAGERPLFDAAVNGVPIVLIAPPSRGGVSRNRYEQFNVGTQGVILNNSAAPSHTRLGGAIVGNPQLGHRPARVILNEVSSAHTSRLLGPLEVGGHAADVVVANPNGISCDGCGFIHSARATLATAVPQFGPDRALSGLDVRQGVITVGPGGLNATEQQQLDLLARGLVIEGELSTPRLRAIVGANQVEYRTLQSRAQAGAGDAPLFAVDIKDLGGMHAGQIHLIATDKGLGVNSTGRLSTLAGDLVLSADGDLSLREILSDGDLHLSSGGRVALTGPTQARGALRVQAPGELVQSGSLQAADIELWTPHLRNSGRIAQLGAGSPLSLRLSRGLVNTGVIHAAGQLEIHAPQLQADGASPGALRAVGDLHIRAQHVGAQEITAKGTVDVEGPDLHIEQSRVQAGGSITMRSAGALRLEGGSVAARHGANFRAAGPVRIAGAGLAAGQGLQVEGQGVDTRASTLEAERLRVDAGHGAFDNRGGKLRAGQDGLGVSAAAVHNGGGEMHAQGTLTLDARGGALDNTGGHVAAGTVAIAPLASLLNQGGTVQAQGSLALTAGWVDNRQGAIATDGDLAVDGAIHNGGGLLQAAGGLAVRAGTSALNLRDGQVLAAGRIDLRAGDLDLRGATLAAGGGLGLVAGAVRADGAQSLSDADLGLEVSALTGGRWSARGDLVAQAQQELDLGGGALLAGGALHVRAQGIRSDGAEIAGAQVMLDAGAKALSNIGGRVMAEAALAVTAQAVDNTGGVLGSGGDAGLQVGGAVRNAEGGLIHAGGGLRLRSGELSNRSGHVQALGELHIDTSRQGLDNSGGQLLAQGAATVQAGDLVGMDGRIQAGGALAIRAQSMQLAGATVWAGASLEASAAAGIDAAGAAVAAAQELRLDAGQGDLVVVGARVDSEDAGIALAGRRVQSATTQPGGGPGLPATRLFAAEGVLVQAQQDIDLSGTTTLAGGDVAFVSREGVLRHDGGVLAAAGRIGLRAASVANRGGTIDAQGQLTIEAAGPGGIDNRDGALGGLGIALAGALDNTAGVIGAGTDGIRIDTRGQGLINQASDAARGIVSAGDIHVTAGDIDNQGGYIGAHGQLAVAHSQRIDNRQGTLLALRDSQLATDGDLDNRGGAILANADLGLRARRLLNQGPGSTVFAGRDLRLQAAEVDNAHTRTEAYDTGLLAGGDLHLAAGALDNGAGAVVAGGTTHLQLSASADNTAGQLAGRRVHLQSPSFTNTDGRVDAQEALSAGLQAFSGDGVLASQGRLDLTLQGDHANRGLVAAGGDLTLRASGHYSNHGSLAAGHTLRLDAASLTNGASGVISSQHSVIALTGELVNEGLINALGRQQLQASRVHNRGRIYGDELAVTAGELANEGRAVLASRVGDVAIQAAVRNTGDALIFSGTDIRVRGPLTNIGSVLQARRHVSVSGELQNLNAGLVTERRTREEPRSEVYITPIDSTERLDRRTLGWGHQQGGSWARPSKRYPLEVFGASIVHQGEHCSPRADDSGGESCLRMVGPTDPAWARFGLAAPGVPPEPPPGGCVEADSSDSGTGQRITAGACGPWWDAWDAYEASLPGAYAQLNAAIAAFNADLATRRISSWWETTLTGQRTTETVVTASQPGLVLAGGDVSYAGGREVDSRTIAHGVVTGGVSAVATTGTRETVEQGTMALSRLQHHGGPLNERYERVWDAPQPLASAPTVETTALPVLLQPPPRDAPVLAATPHPATVAAVPRLEPAAFDLRGLAAPGGQPAQPGPAASSQDPPVAPPVGGSALAGSLRAGQQQALAAARTHLARMAAPQQTRREPPARPAPRVFPPVTKGEGYATVMADIQVVAPASQLYRIDRSPGTPLVQTDADFLAGQSFLSSAWQLDQLDASLALRRYGDGFAEQRLVDDQVMALTGRRFLAGHESSEEAYAALLDAGVMFARAYQLTPGVKLSAEQMALLTTDIAWLEPRTVRLPDGSSAEAIVPVVYLRRPVNGDLRFDGALIAGSQVHLRSTGDLHHSATVVAHDGPLTMQARNIHNSGTVAGQAVELTADDTLDNSGGAIQGLGTGSRVHLSGRDIVLRTTTQTSHAAIEGPHGLSTGTTTSADRIATVSGDSVVLAAQNDIRLQGAVVRAAQQLRADAGGDLLVETVATGYELHVPAGGSFQGRTSAYAATGTQHLGSELSSGGDAVLVARRDVRVTGGKVRAEGQLAVDGDKVLVRAAVNTASVDQQAAHRGGHERVAETQEALSGGTLSAGSELSVSARQDVELLGAAVTSDSGRALLVADGDVRIGTLVTHDSREHERASRSKGLMSSRSSRSESRTESRTAHGSLVSGDTVVIQAGEVGPDGKLATGTVHIEGSQVVGQRRVRLAAGERVTVGAAADQETRSASHEEKRSGLGALGGLSIGSSRQEGEQRSSRTTAVASIVGSIEGDVHIEAGQAVTVTGSQILAPEGDIDVVAQRITIAEARESEASEQQRRQRQSGLSISATGVAADLVRSADQMADAARKVDSPRMQALAAASAVLSARSAASALQGPAKAAEAADAAKAAEPAIGIAITIGSSRSQEHSEHSEDRASGSTVEAGGTVRLRATGAGEDSDLVIQGSRVRGGSQVVLQADDDVQLLAARNQARQRHSHSSSGASVGVGFTAGSSGAGVGVTVSADRGKGSGEGQDSSWTHSHIEAGERVTVISGGDTNLRGAVVSAAQVTARVDGDLRVESLQDTSHYRSRSRNAGGSATFGAGAGGSASASATRIDSEYASVGEQSAIRAGDGGFDVEVGGQAHLVGGQITSTEVALQEGRNRFEPAGGVTLQDVHNAASYRATSVGVGVGVGPSNKPGEGMKAQPSHGGFGSDTGAASSTTTAGISGIAGDMAARTGHAQTGIAPILDKDKVRAEVEAEVVITSAALRHGAKLAGDYAEGKLQEARANGDQAGVETWEEGGMGRAALHGLVGALTGGLAGAVGAGAASVAAPVIEQVQAEVRDGLEAAGLPGNAAGAVASVAGGATAAAVGAAVGGTAGAATAFNTDMNNRQLHPQERARIRELAQKDPEKEARLTAAACALVRCYAEYPEDSQAYRQLHELAVWGASESLAAERNALQQQEGLFLYSTEGLFNNARIDRAKQIDSTYQLTTRATGAVQLGFGTAGFAATTAVAPAACATGLGCVAVGAVGGMSLDAAYAGARQVVSGEPEATMTNGALQGLGLSPDAAGYAEMALGLAPTARVGSVAVDTLTSGFRSSATAQASQASIGGLQSSGLKSPAGSTVQALTQEEFVARETAALRQIGARNTTAAAQMDHATINRAESNLYQQLADRARVGVDTSQDAVYISKTDPSVFRQNNFDTNHVLSGEMNAHGSGSGFHAEFAANGAARIKPGAEIVRHPNGTYRAPVQIWDEGLKTWVDKKAQSTFFPPDWSQARIEYEVSNAFQDRAPHSLGGERGASPSGIQIQFWRDRKNQRITFYPVNEQ